MAKNISESEDLNSSGKSPPEEECGIPLDLRIKRRYTLSPEALKQRQDAANSPAKSEAMKGNRNAYVHGQYVQGFVEQFIRPCKSSCPEYPCSLVEDGKTKPGGDCVDKSQIFDTFKAIKKALIEKKDSNRFDDINEIISLKVAGAMQIVDMLQEDILRDGTLFKEKMFDKQGVFLGWKIKANPLLDSLQNMMPKLGLTLTDLHVTPKSQKLEEDEENAVKGLAGLFAKIGQTVKKEGPE